MPFSVKRTDDMTRYILIFSLAVSLSVAAGGQELTPPDTLPAPIRNFLSPQLFIPVDRLNGYLPWKYAPLLRPVFHVVPVYGFDGKMGFGEFNMAHPDRFFSSLNGSNVTDVPELYLSMQNMLGNTLKLGRSRFYLMSGILYGIQMGVVGNRWGMGTREGIIYRPSKNVSVAFWQQYFGSIAVYSPVLFPPPDGNPAAIRLPATPEVFTVGVQASFVAGEFIIGVGLSVAPLEDHEPRPIQSDQR